MRCTPADEWVRKLWYIYTMEYYSAINTHIYGIQKDGNNDPICETARDTDVKNSLLDSVGEGEDGMI